MRLWTIHPKYLDSKGLVALWREGLLAKAVLEGKTTGYTNHPQLDRFKSQEFPLIEINKYLWGVAFEAENRNYKFDHSKLSRRPIADRLDLYYRLNTSKGQIDFEREHLLKKLYDRDMRKWLVLRDEYNETGLVDLHPMFARDCTREEVEPWERI